MRDFIETESADEPELQWLEDSVGVFFEAGCAFVYALFMFSACVVKLFFQLVAAEK
jgi:hypothetical protein